MNRPTASRKRFGARLKKLRLSKRWRQDELADMLGYSTDFYRHVEAGRRTPPSSLGTRIDELYDIPGDIMTDLCEEAQHDQTPINELRENEQSARHIRIWEHRMVPGLLQTEDYARAVLGTDDDVADRMKRQEILTRDSPVRLQAVLDESVLWRKIGTPKQFHEQLQHLLAFEVQIIPMSYGYHYGIPGPLTILDFDGQPTLVWREGQEIGTIADTAEAAERAREIWEVVLGLALSPKISAEMIEAIAAEIPEDE